MSERRDVAGREILDEVVKLLEAGQDGHHVGCKIDELVFAYAEGWSWPLFGASLDSYESRWSGPTDYSTSIDAVVRLMRDRDIGYLNPVDPMSAPSWLLALVKHWQNELDSENQGGGS